MIRRLFAVASVLSLMLCASAVWLLVRHGRVFGERHEIFSLYLESRHARYTFRGDADRFALCAPPAGPKSAYTPPVPRDADPRPPATLLQLMRNEDLGWRFEQWKDDERQMVTAGPCDKAEAILIWNRLVSTDAGLLIGGLLEALEDPRRAVVAHVYLATLPATEASLPQTDFWGLPRKPTGRFTFEFYGMRIDCPSLGESGVVITPPELACIYRPSWHVDPSQFPSICAQWHARLDRRLVAIPYTRFAAATAVMPVIWLAAWLRRRAMRRRRRRGNLCPICGYDLRASKDRCPECGMALLRQASVIA